MSEIIKTVLTYRTDWRLNGQLHRLDGPAIEWADGDKEWYQYGLLHREGGPAIERVTGIKVWYHHGLTHRLDGPAVENYSGNNYGSNYWYYYDKNIVCQSQTEFEKILKLKAFW
jgi:hypothetical protein